MVSPKHFPKGFSDLGNTKRRKGGKKKSNTKRRKRGEKKKQERKKPKFSEHFSQVLIHRVLFCIQSFSRRETRKKTTHPKKQRIRSSQPEFTTHPLKKKRKKQKATLNPHFAACAMFPPCKYEKDLSTFQTCLNLTLLCFKKYMQLDERTQ